MSFKSDHEVVIDLAEHQMTLQGYVRWAFIKDQIGFSRQRIAQLADKAAKAGYTTATRLEVLRKSMTNNLVRHEYVVTKSNRQWLLDQAEATGLSHHDLLNRAIHNYIQNHDPNTTT